MLSPKSNSSTCVILCFLNTSVQASSVSIARPNHSGAVASVHWPFLKQQISILFMADPCVMQSPVHRIRRSVLPLFFLHCCKNRDLCTKNKAIDSTVFFFCITL